MNTLIFILFVGFNLLNASIETIPQLSQVVDSQAVKSSPHSLNGHGEESPWLIAITVLLAIILTFFLIVICLLICLLTTMRNGNGADAGNGAEAGAPRRPWSFLFRWIRRRNGAAANPLLQPGAPAAPVVPDGIPPAPVVPKPQPSIEMWTSFLSSFCSLMAVILTVLAIWGGFTVLVVQKMDTITEALHTQSLALHKLQISVNSKL